MFFKFISNSKEKVTFSGIICGEFFVSYLRMEFVTNQALQVGEMGNISYVLYSLNYKMHWDQQEIMSLKFTYGTVNEAIFVDANYALPFTKSNHQRYLTFNFYYKLFQTCLYLKEILFFTTLTLAFL